MLRKVYRLLFASETAKMEQLREENRQKWQSDT